jgi:quercetin dioxygenase-like cupin family protein
MGWLALDRAAAGKLVSAAIVALVIAPQRRQTPPVKLCAEWVDFYRKLGRFKMFGFFVDKKDCSHHTIFPGVDIHTMCGENVMLSLVEFEPHAVVEEHSHSHEQVGLMLEGEAEFIIGGESRRVGPGGMWRIPGGVKHKVIAGDRPVRALDVFHPIREDYR